MKNQEEDSTSKSKRTFSLSESTIEKLYLLKSKNQNTTLSEFVDLAIEMYYKEQQKKE